MDFVIYIAIMAAFSVGAAFGVLVMSLLAMASLGEEDLPQVATSLREYQD